VVCHCPSSYDLLVVEVDDVDVYIALVVKLGIIVVERKVGVYKLDGSSVLLGNWEVCDALLEGWELVCVLLICVLSVEEFEACRLDVAEVGLLDEAVLLEDALDEALLIVVLIEEEEVGLFDGVDDECVLDDVLGIVAVSEEDSLLVYVLTDEELDIGLLDVAEDVCVLIPLECSLELVSVVPGLVFVIVIGSGTSTVTVGSLTSMIEYPVLVTVAVSRTVCVVSDPSIVFVDTMTFVTGGTMLVSIEMTVVAAGFSVCVETSTTVSIIVDAAAGVFPGVVAGGEPPSTGTTEYVALLSNGSASWTWGTNGREEDKRKREERAKSVGVEVLRRIVGDVRDDTFRDFVWKEKV